MARAVIILRRTLAGIALLVLLVALIVAGVVGWLHTGSGRAWLAGIIEGKVQGSGLELEIERLEGSLLRRFTVEGIRLAGSGQPAPWIEVDTLSVAWRPLALLGRTVRVESIQLSRVRLDQEAMPDFGAEPDTSTTAGDGGTSLPVAIELARLGVDDAVLKLASGVTIDSVQAALGGSIAPLAGGIAAGATIENLQGHWVEQDAAIGAMGGTIELPSVREWTELEGTLAGPLRWRAAPVDLALTVAGGRYRVSLASRLPAGELAGLHAGLANHPACRVMLEGDGKINPKDLEHHADLELESEAGSIRADARLEGSALNAELDVAGVDPSRWWLRLPDGQVAFRGRVGLARVTDPLAGSSVELTFAPSAIGRLTIDTAAIAARTRGKMVEVDSLEIRAAATRVSARGRYASLTDLDADVTARFADLSIWGEAIGHDLGGQVDLVAHAVGNTGGVDGTVDLRARGVESGKLRAALIDADLEASGDIGAMRVTADVTLDDVAAGGAAIDRCDASGTTLLRRFAVQEFRAVVEAAVDSLPGAPRLTASEVVVDADGRFEDGRLSGHLERFRLRTARGRDAFVLRAPLDFAVAPRDEIVLERLDLALPTGALVGDVFYTADSLAASLRVERVEIEEVARLVRDLPIDSGRVDAMIVLQGGEGGVVGDVSLEASGLTVDARGPGEVKLDLGLRPESVHLALRAITAGDDSVLARGRVPVRLSTTPPFWSWESSAFDLELTGAVDSVIAWSLGPIVAGTALVVDARLAGMPADVELDLTTSITPPPVKGLEQMLVNLEGTVGGGRAHVVIGGERGGVAVVDGEAEVPLLLDLAGGIAVNRSLPLTARLDMHGFDLGTLKPYLGDKIALAGQLDIDSHISGTVGDPRFTGDLQLSGGRFDLVPISLTVRELEVDAGFSNDRIVIRSGQGKTAQGTLRLEGSVPTFLTPDRELDFTVAATGLALETQDIRRATTDLDLALGGSAIEPRLSGRIRVNGATLRLPDHGERQYLRLTDTEIAELTGTPIDTTAAGTVGGSKDMPLDLDLKVEIPRAFFLRNNMVSIEIGGNLALVTGDSGIELNGTLRSIRGQVNFAGQRFEVQRSTVTFTGDTNPALDIDATYDVQEWRIHILVIGTAHEPEISFESEPPLPESDIISLLVFGRRAGDLDSDQQYTLADRAATMLAGAATAPLEAALAEQLGLDLFKIDAGGGESTVTVGKYVNERTMVRLEQSLEESTRRELTVEYSLTRRLRLDVTTDERGQTGADLFYEFDK